MQPIIKISNLVTRFGKLTIHDNLQLEIAPGEIIAIIGGSGSGKSTLLREMILLEKPAAGSIEILGQEILTLSDSQALWLRKVCGVMFQNGALFSSLTVAENIALPLREHTKLSTDFIQEIVALKLGLVGLSVEVGAKYPNQISGGMNKRVAVARALALDPQILFLDEPTAGLDPITAASLDELILQLRQLLGLTIVIITHDLDTLWKVTDRVAVLADRKLIAVEPLNTLVNFEHPWLQEYFHGERGRNAQTE